MSDRIRAKAIRVRVDKRGATLASTAAIGATTLLVSDAGDLTGDSMEAGTLLVDDDSGALLDFTDVTFVEDTDPGDLTSPDTVTLAAPLTAAITAGTELYAWETPDDADDDGVVAEVIALCVPEGDQDAAESGEPIRAVVPTHLQEALPPGRADAPVVLEYDDDADEWSVLRVRGRSKARRAEADDAYTITSDDITAGTVTIPLSHPPIDESVKAFAGGVFQQPVNYTVDYAAGSVTWALDSTTPIGLRLAFHYWYVQRVGTPAFKGSATAAVNSTSITVAVPSVRRDGDLLLIAVARLLPSIPAGWTKVKDVPYGIGGLTVLSKVSDGTETNVTLTAGSSGDQGAICVVYSASKVNASAKDLTTDVPSATNYRAPAANGRTRVSFFLFDGVGTSGSVEEEIATVTGTQRANRTISSGLFSIAAVEGSRAVVTDASLDGAVHDWASISVGLS